MTDFLNINRGGAKTETESVGGGRTLFDSAVYPAKVKQVYLDAYDSGARFASVTLDINGKDYEERLLLTNARGDGFFTDRDGNAQQFSGLTRFDELIFAGGFANNQAANIGPGNVRVWDKDSRSFVIKQMPNVVNGLRDAQVLVAILKKVQNKQKKNPNTGKYDKLNEKEEVNEIQKFAKTDKQTQLEAANGVNPPTFLDAWSKKWAGNVQDTYKQQANASTTGLPSAAGGAAPSSDDLFG